MADAATSTSLTSLSQNFARLAAASEASIVRVHARRGPGASGFAWRSGLVVTTDETIEVEDGIAVTLPDGTRAEATLVGRDPSTDVALLRCEPAAVALAVPHAAPAGLAELALTVGRGRHGLQAALAMIASSGGAWQSRLGGRLERRIGLDMRYDPGLEGAPLLDTHGGLIGMVAIGPRHTSLAIPAETIERVASQLLAKGRIARGYLGLGLQPVAVDGEKRGIMVVSVDDKGPGKLAGILQGDIVLSWNGEAVGRVHELFRRLGPDAVGQTVDLSLRRGGVPATARLTIGERPTT